MGAAEQVALANAVGLWRGEPFADVASDFLHREYGHLLVERRLQALERRIDLNLRDGRHVELIEELVGLTAQHPLRERLWALLIRALDRSGRRADALTTYHSMRRQLAEEIGIEPGAELQELHARVLSGGAAFGAGRGPVMVVPRQLPPDVIGFAGRIPEMGGMDALLGKHEAENSRLTALVVTGMAGVGKTALAAHWARRVADRFPDGQLWVDLRGHHHRAAVTPQQALAYALRAFQIDGSDIPSDLDSRIARYRTVMDGRRMLVVLDNAGSLDQVRPLLPGGTGSMVLVTSRNELSGLVVVEGAQALRLNPLTGHEARQMLTPRLGGHRVDAEPDAVDRIIDRCAGLPLALAIVAARAVARPAFTLTALDEQLADAGDPLTRLTVPDGGVDVRTIFSWSYHTLTPAAAQLFRLLSLHPTNELSTAASAALIGAAPATTRVLLDELTATHLVIEKIPDRFTLHDLVRAYATELATELETPVHRTAGQRRLLEWFTRTAFNARSLLRPGESDVVPHWPATGIEAFTFATERDARDWYDAERHNLVAAVRLAYARGFDDLCWRLAYASWIHLHLTSAWSDVLRTHQVGLRAAQRSGDRSGQAHMLGGIGIAHRVTGRQAVAADTYRKALAISQAAVDAAGAATVTPRQPLCRSGISMFE